MKLATWARRKAAWRGENRVHVIGVAEDRTLCGRDVPAGGWMWFGELSSDEMCLVCERLAMFTADKEGLTS